MDFLTLLYKQVVGYSAKTTRTESYDVTCPCHCCTESYDVTESWLCPVIYIKHDIMKMHSLRSDACLLNSYTKPHKPVTNSTVARWIRSILQNAGIDVSIFLAHSSQTASTSYSANTQLPLADILKAGGWSNARILAEHYNKPISGNLSQIPILTPVHRKCSLIFVHLAIIFFIT